MTTTYELNGVHLDGWDETGDCDEAGVAWATMNLTDRNPGDVLVAIVTELDENGRSVEIARYEATVL